MIRELRPGSRKAWIITLPGAALDEIPFVSPFMDYVGNDQTRGRELFGAAFCLLFLPWITACVLFIAFVLPSQVLAEVHASEGGPEPAKYSEAIDQAFAEYERKNWDEARALLAHAHALYPNARSARGLGMVEFELRHYRECIDYLTEALRSRVKPLDGKLRENTEHLLERARGFVGRVTISLAPEHARLLVDGVPTEVGADSALALQVGDHVLEAQAAGFHSERQRVSVRGGESQRVVFALLRVSEEVESVGTPLRSRRWVWMVAGALVVGAAVGGVLLFRREGDTQVVPVTTSNTPTGAVLRGVSSW